MSLYFEEMKLATPKGRTYESAVDSAEQREARKREQIIRERREAAERFITSTFDSPPSPEWLKTIIASNLSTETLSQMAQSAARRFDPESARGDKAFDIRERVTAVTTSPVIDDKTKKEYADLLKSLASQAGPAQAEVKKVIASGATDPAQLAALAAKTKAAIPDVTQPAASKDQSGLTDLKGKEVIAIKGKDGQMAYYVKSDVKIGEGSAVRSDYTAIVLDKDKDKDDRFKRGNTGEGLVVAKSLDGASVQQFESFKAFQDHVVKQTNDALKTEGLQVGNTAVKGNIYMDEYPVGFHVKMQTEPKKVEAAAAPKAEVKL